MTCNVGRTDQVIRIVLGVVIIIIGLSFKSWWGLIGLIPVITGAIRFCPLYSILRIKNGTVGKRN